MSAAVAAGIESRIFFVSTKLQLPRTRRPIDTIVMVITTLIDDQCDQYAGRCRLEPISGENAVKTIRIIPVLATLLFGVGSILTAAPASAWSGGNGWSNSWNNAWSNGWNNAWSNGWTNAWNNGWENGWANGVTSGQSAGDHALRVIGIELPSGQVAK